MAKENRRKVSIDIVGAKLFAVAFMVVAAYMSPGNRFFAPFYRHTTMEAWTTQNEDTIKNRTRLSMGDVCINPVNWRTDATPATLHDTITVTVAPSRHVLVVSGYSGSEYAAYKGFLNVGDIHSCEPWLYSECLAKNIKVRAKEWRKLHQPTVTRI